MKRIVIAALCLLIVCPVTVFTRSKYQTLSSQINNSGLYINKEYKFRILFPDGWVISKGGSKNVIVSALDYSTASSMNIVAMEYKINDPTDAELRTLVNQADKSIRKDYPNAIILDKGIKLISGRKALYIKFSYTFKQQISTFTNTIMSYTTSKNGIVYTITASTLSDNLSRVEPSFIMSINSFTIQ